jgi:ELWxxDGT repeat protein
VRTAVIATALVLLAAAGPATSAEDRDDTQDMVERAQEGRRTIEARQPHRSASPSRAADAVQAGDGAPALKPGFPVDMLFTGGSYGCCGSGVLVGDVDGDPDLEILASGIARGTTTAVDPDGSLLPGWPVGTRSHEYLSMAELDPATPGFEVVSNNFLDRITARDGSGRALPGWPRSNYIGGLHPAAAVDRDADGTDDIVLNRDDHYYWMMDAQGDVVRDGGWPLRGTGAFQAQAQSAVADLDADGHPEVLGGGSSYSGEVNVGAWHADGTAVEGWPVFVEGFGERDRLSVADVAGDGRPEVVVEASGSVEVLRGDGSRVARWDVTDPAGQPTSTQHPALGDLDGDGDFEVVVGSPLLVHAYQGDGTELPGWPRAIRELEPGVVHNTSPVIGDLDNDGRQDVVASGWAYDTDGKRYHFVWAWDRTGVALAGFPLRLNTSTGWTPAIADLDGNGRSDLVLVGHHPDNYGGYSPGIFAFEYPTGTAAPADWGQFAGGPRRQGVPRQALRPAGQPGTAGDPGPFDRLADAWPGTTGSDPRDLVVLGDRVVHTARTTQAGRELWVSDGTAAGTRLLVDVRPGQGSSAPQDLEVAGNRVWFTAVDDAHGRELWSTDGTPDGTRLESDIVPGAASSRPQELTAVGQRLFFSASTPAGRELWTSDATGTRLAVDTTTAGHGLPFDSSHVRWIAAAGNRVTWLARETDNPEGIRYVALFGSDGTKAGTQKLIPNTDLSAGAGELLVHGGVTEAADGRSWYRIDQRLVRTDGTTSGTTAYQWYEHTDLQMGDPAPRGSSALLASTVGSRGLELARQDSTQVKDLDDSSRQTPVGHVVSSGAPASIRTWGDGWFLTARTLAAGREPWTSDGTSAGTRQIADLAPGATDSNPVPLVDLGDRMLLRASTPGEGDEPWVLGQSGAAARLADVAAGTRGSHASDAVLLGDRIVLVLDDAASGRELWTVRVQDIPVPSTSTAPPPPPPTPTPSPTPTPTTGPTPSPTTYPTPTSTPSPTSAPTSSPTSSPTAPQTTVTRRPSARTTSRRARFRFRADQVGATFECRLDRGRWRSCTAPRTVRRLAIGRHVFRIRATSAHGLRETTPAVVRWRVRAAGRG